MTVIGLFSRLDSEMLRAMVEWLLYLITKFLNEIKNFSSFDPRKYTV